MSEIFFKRSLTVKGKFESAACGYENHPMWGNVIPPVTDFEIKPPFLGEIYGVVGKESLSAPPVVASLVKPPAVTADIFG
jgi:hypothetical protein